MSTFIKAQHHNHQQSNKSNSRNQLSNKESTVYLLKAETSGLYKIGVTTNIQKRIKQIASGNQENICLIACCYGGQSVETALHRKYKNKRCNGEWFALSDEDVFDVENFMGGCNE